MGYKLSISRKFTVKQLHPPRRPSFDANHSLRTTHLRGYQANQFKVSIAIHRQRFDLRHPSPIIRLRQAALPSIGFDFDLQDGGQDLLYLEGKFGCRRRIYCLRCYVIYSKTREITLKVTSLARFMRAVRVDRRVGRHTR